MKINFYLVFGVVLLLLIIKIFFRFSSNDIHPIEYLFYIFAFIVVVFSVVNFKKNNISFSPKKQEIKDASKNKFIRIQYVLLLILSAFFILFYWRNSDKITFHRKLMDLTIEKIEKDQSIAQSLGDIHIPDLPAKKDVLESVDSTNNTVVYLKFYLRASKKSRYVESWIKLDTLNKNWVVEKYRILDRGER